MTEQLFLFDNAVSGPACVVDKVEADVPIVRLDRTLFHPSTAGQRADRGRIGPAQVLAVEFNGRGIDHYLDRADWLAVGDSVTLEVDKSWRALQSIYHSAGHLVAYAMQATRRDSPMLVGQHWPDQAFVDFPAKRPLEAAEVDLIHLRLHDLIEANLPIVAYGEGHARYVKFGELPSMRCNGTHVQSTGDLLRVGILRHEFGPRNLRLFYAAYQRGQSVGEAS